MEQYEPVCAEVPRQQGIMSGINDQLTSKLQTLNNLEERLRMICDRVLGPQDLPSVAGHEAKTLSPVQSSVGEANITLDNIETVQDRIRDHIIRLEEL